MDLEAQRGKGQSVVSGQSQPELPLRALSESIMTQNVEASLAEDHVDIQWLCRTGPRSSLAAVLWKPVAALVRVALCLVQAAQWSWPW